MSESKLEIVENSEGEWDVIFDGKVVLTCSQEVGMLKGSKVRTHMGVFDCATLTLQFLKEE